MADTFDTVATEATTTDKLTFDPTGLNMKQEDLDKLHDYAIKARNNGDRVKYACSEFYDEQDIHNHEKGYSAGLGVASASLGVSAIISWLLEKRRHKKAMANIITKYYK